jgi:RNA polymerase sigma factor for flagellar operon FliA
MTEAAKRDQLIEAHLEYVRKIAAKVKRDIGGSFDYDELVAYGTRGLVEAAGRFDPARGVAFTTFSYYRIRGAIFDGLRETGWLPRSVYARFSRASNDLLENHTARENAAEKGERSTEQVVEDLNQSLDQLATIFVTSLDAERQGEVADTATPDSEETVSQKQLGEHVRKALSSLPDREREILDLYYYEGLNLVEIGKRLGSSKSWTSRLHARAIKLLASAMAPALGST